MGIANPMISSLLLPIAILPVLLASPEPTAIPAATGCGTVAILDQKESSRVIIAAPSPQEHVELVMEWQLNGASAEFKPASRMRDGRMESVTRMGETTLRRTILANPAEPALVIHCLADKPGDLSFRVSLTSETGATARLEDRRQLILPPTPGHPGLITARAWVLPFEADVTTENGGIAVRGEGEALILLVFSRADDPCKTLNATLERLGNTYDKGHFPPNPAKIWQGLVADLSTSEDKP
jgi:hypothetical protein